MKRLTLSLALIGLSTGLAGAASAEIATQQMVRELANRGYSEIEVYDQGAQIKVEARYRNREVEMYFDQETGEQLQVRERERERERVRSGQDDGHVEGADDDREDSARDDDGPDHDSDDDNDDDSDDDSNDDSDDDSGHDDHDDSGHDDGDDD